MAEADVTTGELGRRVDRLETAMTTGFATLADQIRGLQFVSAGVYASDRAADVERMSRLEDDVQGERRAREEAQRAADQRAWQSRWSLIAAAVGVPFGIVGSVIAAVITARIGH